MNTQYITDGYGKKLSVILPIEDYRKLMEELEELADLRLYDEAMAGKEAAIPVDLAFQQIEDSRKKSK